MELLSKGFVLIGTILILLLLRQKYHIHTLEELQLLTQQYTDPVTLSQAFLVVTLAARLCFVPISIFKAFAGLYFGFLYGFTIAFSAVP